MFSISAREEIKKNQEVNRLIENQFNQSVKRFTIGTRYGCPAKINNISSAYDYEDVSYGESTILQDGAAICCLQQALEFVTGKEYNLSKLAYDVARFYDSEEGTCPYLFDYFGCRRATDIQELIDTLMRNSIITCHVANNFTQINNVYRHKENSRRKYVNVVGMRGQKVIIDCPYEGRITSMEFLDFAHSIYTAWIW